MTSPTSKRLARFAAVAALFALAACADRDPATLPGLPAPVIPGGGSTTVLTCTAQVRAGTVSCEPASARDDGGARRVILGGQGTNVKLASSGTAYDAGTQILRSSVTVQNLTSQPLGVVGDSIAPEGVRVFFASGPSVTVGTGSVSVANADGMTTFTSANQPYFQYDGILVPGAVSAAKEWRFSLPSTVETFIFTVYVAAPVRAEAGYVSVTPIAPTMLVGDTQRIVATVRGVTGREVTGQSVRWWSSAASVATVDSTGKVTAVGAGTAYITATSGSRAGRAEVKVGTTFSPLVPSIVSVEMDRTSLASSWADSVAFRVVAKAAGTGVTGVSVLLMEPNGYHQYGCSAAAPLSGTVNDGSWSCKIPFEPYTRRGVWRVWRVEATIWNGESRVVDSALLDAAGAQSRIRVENGYDVTPPVLRGLTISPASVNTASATTPVVDVDVSVADSGDVDRVSFWLRNPAAEERNYCTTYQPWSGEDSAGVFRCSIPFYPYARGGTWTIDEMRIEDVVGNVTTLHTADLQAAGYPVTISVTSPGADNVAPTITSFTLPAGAPANTSYNYHTFITANGGQSPIIYINAVFEKVGGTQTKTCSDQPYTGVSATLHCIFTFDASDAGTWRVKRIYVMDEGDAHNFTATELKGLGYFTQFTVVAQ